MAMIELDIKKSVEENAGVYFDKAKKAKKKMKGAEEAVSLAHKKLEKLEKMLASEIEKRESQVPKTERKRHWFEKFRWFKTSDGMLVIGGRDATTNEIVIKKHTDKDDLVFHTDMAGSPFFVLKTDGKKPSDEAISQVADATCTFSKAWKLGLQMQKVFYVSPDQVTKEANTGEYLTKGAFMIRGKTNYVDNKINLAVGSDSEGAVMAGPIEAVKVHCSSFALLEQGGDKASDIAKKLKRKIGGETDDILRTLPAGNFHVL